MSKREVMQMVLAGKKPPYVPWSFGFTVEAREKLVKHYGTEELCPILDSHILGVGYGGGSVDIGNDCNRDAFGVIWDRSQDKDIGVIKGQVLPEPTLDNYTFPDPLGELFFGGEPSDGEDERDGLRVYGIGFSLYERAWTMRGMEELMMDMIENPGFVHELLTAIADHNIARLEKALVEYELDAVHFGDDWGQQHGLIMGPKHWHEFIYPQLKRMYGVAKDAGKFVTIHSCGDVDELFDDLIDIGLNGFNPFQPEAMDVESLMKQYKGRLSFHGGLSTQKTLPFGTPDEVREETRWLLNLGRDGGYILAPAHAVEGDVPLENMLAFIDETLANRGS